MNLLSPTEYRARISHKRASFAIERLGQCAMEPRANRQTVLSPPFRRLAVAEPPDLL
jgi:hypothetical protein